MDAWPMPSAAPGTLWHLPGPTEDDDATSRAAVVDSTPKSAPDRRFIPGLMWSGVVRWPTTLNGACHFQHAGLAGTNFSCEN